MFSPLDHRTPTETVFGVNRNVVALLLAISVYPLRRLYVELKAQSIAIPAWLWALPILAFAAWILTGLRSPSLAVSVGTLFAIHATILTLVAAIAAGIAGIATTSDGHSWTVGMASKDAWLLQTAVLNIILLLLFVVTPRLLCVPWILGLLPAGWLLLFRVVVVLVAYNLPQTWMRRTTAAGYQAATNWSAATTVSPLGNPGLSFRIHRLPSLAIALRRLEQRLTHDAASVQLTMQWAPPALPQLVASVQLQPGTSAWLAACNNALARAIRPSNRRKINEWLPMNQSWAQHTADFAGYAAATENTAQLRQLTDALLAANRLLPQDLKAGLWYPVSMLTLPLGVAIENGTEPVADIIVQFIHDLWADGGCHDNIARAALWRLILRKDAESAEALSRRLAEHIGDWIALCLARPAVHEPLCKALWEQPRDEDDPKSGGLLYSYIAICIFGLRIAQGLPDRERTNKEQGLLSVLQECLSRRSGGDVARNAEARLGQDHVRAWFPRALVPLSSVGFAMWEKDTIRLSFADAAPLSQEWIDRVRTLGAL